MSPQETQKIAKMILKNPKALVPMMQHAKKTDIADVIKMLGTRINVLDNEKAAIKKKIAANHVKQEKIKEEMAAEAKSVAAPVERKDKAQNLMATLKKVADAHSKKTTKKSGGLGGILAILPLLLKGLGGH